MQCKIVCGAARWPDIGIGASAGTKGRVKHASTVDSGHAKIAIRVIAAEIGAGGSGDDDFPIWLNRDLPPQIVIEDRKHNFALVAKLLIQLTTGKVPRQGYLVVKGENTASAASGDNPSVGLNRNTGSSVDTATSCNLGEDYPCAAESRIELSGLGDAIGNELRARTKRSTDANDLIV